MRRSVGEFASQLLSGAVEIVDLSAVLGPLIPTVRLATTVVSLKPSGLFSRAPVCLSNSVLLALVSCLLFRGHVGEMAIRADRTADFGRIFITIGLPLLRVVIRVVNPVSRKGFANELAHCIPGGGAFFFPFELL
ncbi:hypothetical protein MAXJ12_29390 [Mesorhizobium alhagi CCNWXJ12-2]|uniref:Uncharacterized protein n=1 Tax=Mesorhizobium alhagi CCNWXJ12-2 TaxID=1107882 RepID=H0I091_9HYPH|nr:hypothetical protein MAXJ12_29390 [Mesorhizobium alhagi CCNWXJ12-2]